ncbi:hypothetical protein O6P43_024294 [Quillaja saponaria]|uniref:Uncharacterized protein n=1 Tax=Quillaja saponaria TaxID=32244 RepID=A0AAD7L818_QUISA|nr:hypothetical protein O6P43_024294 [Quillaja saponaria]
MKSSYRIFPSDPTSTSLIHSSNSEGSSFSPMLVRMCRSSVTDTYPVESLSRTLKASQSWRSNGSGFICLAIRSRKRGKSKGALRSSSAMMDLSWAWVGLPPRERIRIPSSEGAILPSPSESNRVKASFIEETWSSLRSLPIVDLFTGFWVGMFSLSQTGSLPVRIDENGGESHSNYFGRKTNEWI